MKIVCDNCATKYSIADEKVRGKVFKIRCKKCSHIIVVKGTEGGDLSVAPDSGTNPIGEAGEAAAEAPSGDGWHVVVNGEQVGPLSPAEVRAKFAAGEIDAETFTWREGYADWLRLASIDEFRDLAAAAAPPAADTTRRTGTDDLFGGATEAAPSAGADLFGAPASNADLFSGATAPAAQPANGGGGLFAQPAAAAPEPARRSSPTPGFGTRALDEPAASPAANQKNMTGQRNENSVLFSLNNLQALASGGPAASAKPAAGAVDNRPGFANSQTEGSGLIDIRAMAAATLSSSPPTSEAKSNDLPAFASAPVFSPIAAPILMPAAPSGPPKWVWPVIGLGVAAVLSIVVVGVLILTKKPDQVAVVAPPAAAPAAGTAAPVAAAPAAAAPAAAAAPGAPAAAAPAAAAPAPAAAEKGSHSSSRSSSRSASSAKPGAAPAPVAAAAKPSAAPVAAEAPAKKAKKGDDLDDLLNGASPDKPKAAAREERSSASDENLPDQLDKGAIVAGMGKVKGKVAGCYEQYKVPGLANVAVTIAKSGKVQSASVAGAFAGTPTGECVTKAVKSASFSPFKGAAQTINYPFMLR